MTIPTASLRDSGHTAGPWFPGWGEGVTGPRAGCAVAWTQKWPVRCNGPHGDRLVCAIPYTMEDDARVRADAALIAAAPDLLQALELVLDTYGFDSSTDSSIWQTVTAAIAKAKGSDQ